MREAVGRQGWNPALKAEEQTLEDLKFGNYVKEIFLDSDTKAALISSAPSDIPEDWFLTNAQMAQARDRVNGEAGGRRRADWNLPVARGAGDARGGAGDDAAAA